MVTGGVTNYFQADGSSGYILHYHYGTEKISTNSLGVDITGTCTDFASVSDMMEMYFFEEQHQEVSNIVFDRSDYAIEFVLTQKS